MEHKTQLATGDADRHPKKQGTAAKLLGGLYGRYPGLRKRLADMLGSGDRDYAALTALSQEIGRMRQRIRDNQRRRQEQNGRQKAVRVQQGKAWGARWTSAANGNRSKAMRIESRKRAKLSRVVRYGSVALIAAWSLLAIMAYAATLVVSGWLAQMPAADGWIAWGGELISQAGGPVIAVVWFAGTLAIFGLITVVRRSIA